jgi:hypothetical protein
MTDSISSNVRVDGGSVYGSEAESVEDDSQCRNDKQGEAMTARSCNVSITQSRTLPGPNCFRDIGFLKICADFELVPK